MLITFTVTAVIQDSLIPQPSWRPWSCDNAYGLTFVVFVSDWSRCSPPCDRVQRVDGKYRAGLSLLAKAEFIYRGRVSLRMAAPWLRLLVASLSPPRPGFAPGSVHLWWIKWHWDRFLSKMFGFPCQYSIVALHTLISSGEWTIDPLVFSVQRYRLALSTWTIVSESIYGFILPRKWSLSEERYSHNNAKHF
jgi:hypothetical protein